MSVDGREVPFLDLVELHAELGEQIEEALLRVARSGRFLLGAELEAFEAAWATAVGARSCVGVGSGLDALALALRALGVGVGDEVLVPGHTFVATWFAVLQVGATPVAVDVDPRTGAWDPSTVAAHIGPRTRAMVPVHLYGHPADLDPLVALARRHDLVVVDDAAQAHGARYRGAPVGALTDATAWSFYPGKNLGALGDGGAVTCDDAAIAERVRSLRNYGSREKHVHTEVGANSRLDELQAAVLTVKLSRLDEFSQRRRAVAGRYAAALTGPGLALPGTAPWAAHAWHLYVVRSPHRDALREHLCSRGVATGVHYPLPPHRQPAFTGTSLAGSHLPGSDLLAREVLSLPMGPHLSRGDQDRVVAAVREFVP